MKYLMFACERYYPQGGWEDLVGEFETIENAMDFAKANDVASYGEIQIVDIEKRKVVMWGDTYYCAGKREGDKIVWSEKSPHLGGDEDDQRGEEPEGD